MTLLVIRVPGEIRAKARAARRVSPNGKVRSFVDKKTASAENLIRICAIQQVGQPVLDGAIELSIAVTVIIPKSWSRKKQVEARAGRLRPTTKPDFDNIEKMISDALKAIVWRDDAQVVDSHFSKHYGDAPGAVLTIRELGPRA